MCKRRAACLCVYVLVRVIKRAKNDVHTHKKRNNSVADIYSTQPRIKKNNWQKRICQPLFHKAVWECVHPRVSRTRRALTNTGAQREGSVKKPLNAHVLKKNKTWNKNTKTRTKNAMQSKNIQKNGISTDQHQKKETQKHTEWVNIRVPCIPNSQAETDWKLFVRNTQKPLLSELLCSICCKRKKTKRKDPAGTSEGTSGPKPNEENTKSSRRNTTHTHTRETK